jgi:polar amino acid transport system substrate-binding protein
LTTISPEALRELAPTGRLRAAINAGNAVLVQKNEQTGELTGITVDLARELARRLGIDVELIPFNAAGKVADSAGDDIWDISFLAVDPARATGISFSTPYVVIESSYMVRNDSPLHVLADVDREGVRVAVGKGAAYDLYLTRALKHAKLERAGTSELAIELFVEKSLEAVAGVKQPLLAYAASHRGFRVMDGSFTAIAQAMGVPKGREAAAAYIDDFIEELKASGFVASSLQRAGQHDAVVAPASTR